MIFSKSIGWFHQSIGDARKYWGTFNSFQSSVVFHIEASLLIYNVNQMNGFYMKCNTGVKWVKERGTLVPNGLKSHETLHNKRSFPLRISSVSMTKSAVLETADLATFTEKILNGKLIVS